MRFPLPLRRATLLTRYKRFLSDHRFEDGSTVTAHVANPGAMTGLIDEGLETWLSPAATRKRKLPFSWEMVRIGDGLVGVNTGWPNRLAADAIEAGAIPPLAGYDTIRREVAYGTRSRVDFLLEAEDRPPCYVEVKNVHLKRGPAAEFPDSVTARGTKHLRELAAVAQGGARAVMLYIVQREDCDSFTLAADIRPGLRCGLRRGAHERGGGAGLRLPAAHGGHYRGPPAPLRRTGLASDPLERAPIEARLRPAGAPGRGGARHA